MYAITWTVLDLVDNFDCYYCISTLNVFFKIVKSPDISKTQIVKSSNPNCTKLFFIITKCRFLLLKAKQDSKYFHTNQQLVIQKH